VDVLYLVTGPVRSPGTVRGNRGTMYVRRAENRIEKGGLTAVLGRSPWSRPKHDGVSPCRRSWRERRSGMDG
jgi:hypothetical protein